MGINQLTLFTFGYEGWGSSTEQLIEAVDAVEASRGYQPPIFVDIRLSRSVRAPGFIGESFAKTVGRERYRWMEALGNVNVKTGGPIKIKDPSAASVLLETAEKAATENRRVIFFCHCQPPAICHRWTVADLVLKVAQRRKLAVQIVEWPGGEPRLKGLEVAVSPTVFDKICNGGVTIPLEPPFSLAEMAAVPWVSLIYVRDNENGDVAGPFVTGPAEFRISAKAKMGGWCFMHKGLLDEPEDKIPDAVHAYRAKLGFDPRFSS